MSTNLQHESDYSKEHSLNQEYSSQEVFEKTMEAELPVFVKVIEEAFERTRKDLQGKPLSFQTRNTKSGRMNENVKGLLFEHFPDEMDENKNRRFFFDKGQNYRLYFKKLDCKSLRPMNVVTQASQKILQTSMNFPGRVPIFIGYVMNRTNDAIASICAVYFSEGQKVWVTDLRRFSDGLTSIELFSNSPDDDAPLVVQPKRVKQADEQDSDDAPLEVRPKKKA